MSAVEWLRASLVSLAAAIPPHGPQAYLVGGCLRDRLLGRTIRDVDVATAADPRSLGQIVAANAGGACVVLDEDPVLVRLVGPGGLHLDITGLRGGGIFADLMQRDFTINALGAPCERSVLDWLLGESQGARVPLPLDPSGGQDDLRRGVIRAVSDSVFLDDPLRLLRAPRFRAELGFTISADTLELMRRDASLVTRPAAERVRDEIAGMLARAGALSQLRLLDDLGILALLLPEMEALRGLEQSHLHRWNAHEHSLRAVRELEWVAARMSDPVLAGADGPAGQRLAPRVAAWLDERLAGGHNHRVLLKLAALLHDVSKPLHRSVEPGGRIRFIGHAETGAGMAAEIMRRFRFSSRETESVRRLVAYHMRPPQVAESGASGRAVYRFFRDTGEDGVGVLLLSLADHRATGGPNLEDSGWRRHVALTWQMLSALWDPPAAQVSPPRLVTGNDLMRELGLAAGPAVGAALEAIREAQAQGEVVTRAEAIDLARQTSRPVSG